MIRVFVRPGIVGLAVVAVAGWQSAAPETGHPVTRGAPADSVIERWIEAAGGPGVWDAVRTLRYTVETVWYDPETARETRRRPRHVWIRKQGGGFQVRVERTEPDGRYVQVWDGSSGWALRDGLRLPDTAAAVREIPHVAGDLTYWIGLPWKLRDPGVRLRSVPAAAPASGVVVEVTFDPGTGLSPGDTYWYHFPDPASPFPAEVEYRKEGEPPEARTRIRLMAWGSTGPARHVGERLQLDAAGRPVLALLIRDVIANPHLGDALFRPPR